MGNSSGGKLARLNSSIRYRDFESEVYKEFRNCSQARKLGYFMVKDLCGRLLLLREGWIPHEIKTCEFVEVDCVQFCFWPWVLPCSPVRARMLRRPQVNRVRRRRQLRPRNHSQHFLRPILL